MDNKTLLGSQILNFKFGQPHCLIHSPVAGNKWTQFYATTTNYRPSVLEVLTNKKFKTYCLLGFR